MFGHKLVYTVILISLVLVHSWLPIVHSWLSITSLILTRSVFFAQDALVSSGMGSGAGALGFGGNGFTRACTSCSHRCHYCFSVSSMLVFCFYLLLESLGGYTGRHPCVDNPENLQEHGRVESSRLGFSWCLTAEVRHDVFPQNRAFSRRNLGKLCLWHSLYRCQSSH